MCISCPTAFVEIMKEYPESNAYLFEYDRRFAIYRDRFVEYDYNEPLAFKDADELVGSFDFILADPPFLSKECFENVAKTVKFLAKDSTKLLICTGAVMEADIKTLLDAKMTSFHPEHSGGLANEFRCYTNYPSNAFPFSRP